MYYIKNLTLALIIVCSVSKVRSQSVTSPYSISGLGDIENRNIGRTAGMASVSAAMRYDLNVNTFNPASLTAMPTHLFLFEVGAKGRSSRFLQPGIDTTSQASSDFAVKRLSLAFKATKKMAFSIGLQPFSNTIMILVLQFHYLEVMLVICVLLKVLVVCNSFILAMR